MKVLLLLSALVSLWSGVLLFPDLKQLHQEAGNANIWAVLVAGSNTWDNYRHQADVCHAYQILHSHGIPDDRIIVMMTDDLAHNEQNPTPGIIINHPKGKDVYNGVPHDYTQEAVTPENFMAVLKGDAEAVKGVGSGKVLRSGPNDHVFVYFADHGAPGLIAFPESELTAKQLNKTIAYMHEKQKYNKMVIYIEACESGSMFQNILPNNINVFATTAANAIESSYACYFDDDRDTYLGDVYSVNWMEDSDKEDISKETLSKQYKIVKQETNTSHVKEFGDLSIGKMHVSEFQGRKQTQPNVLPKVQHRSVRNRDVYLEIVHQKIRKATSDAEKSKLQAKLADMLKKRHFLSTKVKDMVHAALQDHLLHPSEILHKRRELKNFECYDEAREYFKHTCFSLARNHYALDFMYVLVNLCEHGISAEIQRYAMEQACTHSPVHGIF